MCIWFCVFLHVTVSTAVDVVDNGYIEHNGHNNHDHAAENGIVENGEIPCGPVKDTSVLTMEIQEPKRKSVSTPIKRYSASDRGINSFKPEFTIVIFILYKPRIAVAILDL